jgi:Beta/Gamma crystallin
MNIMRFVAGNLKLMPVLFLVTISQSIVYAESEDCWADFFEESEYKGKHFSLKGAANLENLNQVGSEDWNRRIHSMKIGPKAKVTVFQCPRFELPLTEMAKKRDFMNAWGITEQDIKEDSELIFSGEAAIHDFGDFNFHKKVRSLKVECLE